jgi:hypothetical protein
VLSNSDGYAVKQDAGLVGKAYGRKAVVLARQLLVLPPADYSLQARIREEAEEVRIFVRCASNEVLAAMRTERTGTQTVEFSVPEGCKAQWVEVRADANINAQAINFAIQSIDIAERPQ